MAREQSDLISGCNQQGMSVSEFQEMFCNRCKQPACKRAAWGRSLMDRRVVEQVQRLLHATQADPGLLKYARLVDFKDMAVQKAQALNIANQRGDWSVPEIAITDGQVEVSSASQVDAAVRAMKNDPVESQTQVPDKPDSEQQDIEPLEEQNPSSLEPDPPSPSRPVQKGKKVQAPSAINTQVQQGVMLGGGPPPEPKRPSAKDPWSPPPSDGAQRVKVGATIKMGG